MLSPSVTLGHPYVILGGGAPSSREESNELSK